MVKTKAQTLQAFGTELAETELPNDAEATTNLLHAHTLKKDEMKVGYALLSFPCFLARSLLKLIEDAIVLNLIIGPISRRTCKWRCLRVDACWTVLKSLYRQTLNTR